MSSTKTTTTTARGSSRSTSSSSRKPILIVPGFMSSGLQVKASSIKPEWLNQRIWINLTSLGFSAAHVKRHDDHHDHHPDDDDDEEEEEEEVYDDTMNDEENQLAQTKTNNKTKNGTKKETENEEQAAAKKLRNAWLHHMALNDDMTTERAGVQVRNIEGLQGVDYLSPGMLLNYVSYVFGPVINACKKAGYQEGVDLDAAPYDWRLAFEELETRDQYCTRTLQQIESMVQNNSQNSRVVLVCHSMGCLVGHFLLKYALEHKGQEWIDQHIDTYMPVGGPHLGAPKALRSFISGDKMGLEAFLTDSEALLMGRSLSSGLLLLPQQLPPEAPPCAIIQLDGALQVSFSSSLKIDTDAFLKNRVESSMPETLQLAVTFDGTTVKSRPVKINANGKIECQQVFHFRLPSKSSSNSEHKIFVLLLEPGLRMNRKEDTAMRRCCDAFFFKRWSASTSKNSSSGGKQKEGDDHDDEDEGVKLKCFCPVLKEDWHNNLLFALSVLTFWWLWGPLLVFLLEVCIKIYFGFAYFVLWGLYKIPIMTTDEVLKASGSASVLATASFLVTEPSPSSSSSNDDDDDVDMETHQGEMSLYRDWKRNLCCGDKRSTPVTIHCKWIQRQNDTKETTMAVKRQYPKVFAQMKMTDATNNKFHQSVSSKAKSSTAPYASISGDDLLVSEGLEHILKRSQTILRDGYKVYPQCSSLEYGTNNGDAPPVSKVKAVYGINLATEVGAVYRRKKATLVTPTQARNIWAPDAKATLSKAETTKGYTLKNGFLFENATRTYPSGDGTVPYWSLNYAKKWESPTCKVEIDEIPNAEHREILADSRFHKVLLDYCTIQQ